MVLVCVSLIAIVGMIAIVTDFSFMQHQRNMMQTAADSAAMAGSCSTLAAPGWSTSTRCPAPRSANQPATLAPSYIGTSIGHWIDSGGSGRYDTLEVETRGFKGPRLIENTGIPLHLDNQTVIKERFHLDASDPNLLHEDVTLIDDALTRPWTVTRDFRRRAKPVWIEYLCSENNNLVLIGGESYFVREDGYLMPMGKDQKPPDLLNFAK